MSLLAAFSATRARKTLLAAISTTVIATGLGMPSTASAKPIFAPCCKFAPKPLPHHSHGFGYGYGAAALAGGLALGAIAASVAEDDCVIERRRMIGGDGMVYLRQVRVCY